MDRGKTTLYAVFGLACTFAGIWTGDFLVAETLDRPDAVFFMRIVSLVVYLAAFAATAAWALLGRRANERKAGKARPLAAACVATAFALHAAGIGGIAGGASGSVAAACVVASKLIGVPVTVLLAAGFSRIEPSKVAKGSLLAMAAAFAANNAVRAATQTGIVDVGAAFALSIVLAGCGGFCAIACAGIRGESADAHGTPVEAQDKLRGAQKAAASVSLSTSRRTAVVMAIAIAATAAMLGFLRDDAGAFQAAESLPAITAALLLVCLACLPRIVVVDFTGLLVAGLCCVVAAFLVGPLISPFAPDVPALLAGLGTVFLETAAWTLVVRFAVRGRRPIAAAMLARLFAVAGHLGGALLSRGMFAATHADIGSLHAGELALSFVYFLFALALIRFPLDEGLRDRGEAARSTAPDTARETDHGDASAAASAYAPAASKERDARKADLPPHAGEDGARPSQKRAVQAHGDASAAAPRAESGAAPDAPSLAERAAMRFGLTARETDVFDRLACGRDIAFIESDLCISRNTAKMHIRHVYQKTGVHSKQELIDLAQSLAHGRNI